MFKKKMEVLWLKSLNYPYKEIMKIAQISKVTLCDYLKDYQEGGIEKLKELKFYHRKSELNEYTKTIEEYFFCVLSKDAIPKRNWIHCSH
jgi:transposase